MSKLFAPVKVGDLTLKNRIILAPLTRNRNSYERIPNDLMASYYSQRSDFGLIITEATSIELRGVGYPRTPGIWNEEQIKHWAKITDEVHRKGGTIFMQLWHVGRISDPMYINESPVAPSAVKPQLRISLVRPEKNFETPRELSGSEIKNLIVTYQNAAKNAKKAGFDGVEIHGANGYLLDQFLQTSTNLRTDEFGGSLANRLKFPLEVTDAITDIWGAGRVGYHISPRCDAHNMKDENPLETFSALVSELSKRKLAFIFAREYVATDSIGPQLRKLFTGTYIANEGFTKETAEDILNKHNADAVAFGVLSIANPDLVEKFKNNLPLRTPNPKTFYNQHKYLFNLAEPIPSAGYYESDKIGYTSFPD